MPSRTSAPFRQMVVPSGHTMSVAMTNIGSLGWTTDRTGYRYRALDPLTGLPWPAMHSSLLSLPGKPRQRVVSRTLPPTAASSTATPSARVSRSTRIKTRRTIRHPIVSVSLGLPATFLLGTHATHRHTPSHSYRTWGHPRLGDPARLIYHGVAPIAEGSHPLTGTYRINLTFRRVLAPALSQHYRRENQYDEG